MKKLTKIGLLLPLFVFLLSSYPSFANINNHRSFKPSLTPSPTSTVKRSGIKVLGVSIAPIRHQQTMMNMTQKITITNNGSPLSGVLVTINNQQGITNKQGQVDLENIMTGSQVITTIYNNEKRQQTVMVMGSTLTVAYEKGQLISISPLSSLANVFFGKNIFITALIFILILVAIGFGILAYLHGKKKKDTLVVESSNTTEFKTGRLYVQKHQSLGIISVIFLLIAIGLTIGIASKKQSSNTLAATTVATVANLPIPQNIHVVAEDNSALLTWDDLGIGKSPNDQADLEKGIGGYAIFWGVYDANTHTIINPIKKVTSDPGIQLQPMTPGVTYGAYLTTIDYSGNVSNPTSTITITPDSSRVDKLRSQMTGFFDDFNNPAGFFDELKWNNAYSGCVGAGDGGQFINGQFHAHNQVSSSICDRGQNVSRPRAIFDYTNRTGTIVFDMDGADRRDTWYLDLYPSTDGPIDLPGHVTLDSTDPNDATPPVETLRYRQSADSSSVSYFDKKGVAFGTTDSGCGANNMSYCTPALPLLKNYRRHWKITINQDSPTTIATQVFVDGVLINDVKNVPFAFSKVYMDWVLFAYNNSKEGFPTSLLHWDNFGFDGPAQTIETHNYTNGIIGASTKGDEGCGGGHPNTSTDSPVTQTIKIPDSIQGALAARLMVTIQMSGCAIYGTNANDTITINGKTYSYKDVAKLPWNGGIQPSTNIGEQEIIDIPQSDFGNIKTGDNSIVFHIANAGVINTHVEIDFPKGQAPSYTPPSVTYSNLAAMPKIADIGPGAVISSVNGHLDSSGQWVGDVLDTSSSLTAKSEVSGIVPLYVSANGTAALYGTGTNPGISEYDLTIDRQRFYAKSTASTVAPAYLTDKYDWDTTHLCNGVHELFVEAFNPNGTPSLADYVSTASIGNGDYYPILIKTNNPGQMACTPLSTPPDTLILTPVYPPYGHGTPQQPTSEPIQVPSATIIPTAIISPTGTNGTPAPTGVNATPTQLPSTGVTLGNTSIGSIVDVNDPNDMTGSKVTTGDSDQTAHSMNVYVGDIDSSPHDQYQMAIFTDNNGKPGDIIAHTQNGTLTANSWNSLPITATLHAHTIYWLLYNTNSSSSTLNNMHYNSTNAEQGVYSSGGQSFGTWPQTFPSYSLTAWDYSLYVSM